MFRLKHVELRKQVSGRQDLIQPAGQLVLIKQEFVGIPYYAWANRGPGEMIVWIRNRDVLNTAEAPPLPS